MAEGERVVRGALPASTVVMNFLRSSVGAKVIMSLTGIGLWVFVIIHLIGNLQIFDTTGNAINEYGVWLRELGHGTLIWIARGGLLLAFAVHIVFGIRLAMLNRAARGPVAYKQRRNLRTIAPALTMATTGLLVLAFLIFHLAHFTWGFVDEATFKLTDAQGRHDVFRMVWWAFKTPLIVIIYIVGQILLLSHLVHGTASLWQSLGWHHRVWSPVLRIAGRSIAVLIFVGNIGIVMAIFLMWGQPK